MPKKIFFDYSSSNSSLVVTYNHTEYNHSEMCDR